MREEEDGESTQHIIERSWVKRQVFCIHQKDARLHDVPTPDFLGSFPKHLFRQIYANHLTTGTNVHCRREEVRASADTNVEYPSSFGDSETLNQSLPSVGKGI